MVEAVHLLGMREQAARLVHDERAVLPRIPVAQHDLHELVGAVVPQVVRHMGIDAHVQGLAVVDRGDDVPGRSAAAHQIERGEHAGDVERLVVGAGIGRAEAQPLGRHPHHGQDGDRIHLDAADAVLDRMGVIAAIAVRHRQPIVEEPQMEAPGFQDAADAAVVLGRGEVRQRQWMPPRADEVRAVLRLQEGDQRHLPHRCLFGPGVDQTLACPAAGPASNPTGPPLPRCRRRCMSRRRASVVDQRREFIRLAGRRRGRTVGNFAGGSRSPLNIRNHGTDPAA